MRNPFARQAKSDALKPTLRERASALKSSATRVFRNGCQTAPETISTSALTLNPVLASMVAEWVKIRERFDSGNGPEDDEEANLLHRHWVDLQLAIYRFPAETLADLQAKAPVLLDEIAIIKGDGEDSARSLPVTAWRSVLADIERLSRAHQTDAEDKPLGSPPIVQESPVAGDVELLALGQSYDAIHAEWTLAIRACREAEGRAAALLADLTSRPGWRTQEAHDVAWALPDVARTADAHEDVCLRMEAIAAEIRALPARTVDGLAVKARAVIPAIWRSGEYEKDAGLGDGEDWIELNARSLIDECLSLAGVDWTGRRFRPATEPPHSPPVLTPASSVRSIDLSRLGINDLCLFYETLKAARSLWGGAMCLPLAVASTDPLGCVERAPFGECADFEDDRAGFLMDRIVEEAAARSPVDRYERDNLLALRIEHEIACEGRILDPALLADIAQVWG